MRLWGRCRLGACLAALAAAAGATGSALGAGAPPARAWASAVGVVVPGQADQGTGLVMAWGSPVAQSGFRDPAAPGLVVVGRAAAAASKHTAEALDAKSSTTLRHVRLLHGTVRASEIATGVDLWRDDDGRVAVHAGGGIDGLVVLGRPTAATPGREIALGDWGVLDLLVAHSSGAGTAGPATATTTGLELHLLRDHAGLPAGTAITLASAHAALTPLQPAGGDNGTPGGGSTPGQGQPTGGGTTDGGNGTHPSGGSRPTPPPQRGSGGGSTTATPTHHQPAPIGRTHHVHRAHPAVRHRAHRAHPAVAAAVERSLHVLAASRGGRARVLRAALAQVGWPYIWGGDNRSEGGFDCSGLVDYAYARAGMPLPGRPTAAVLWQMSRPVGRAHLAPGDLAFLYTRRRAPYHVALYAGDGLVVVAPHSGAKVTIEPLAAVAWDGYGRLLQGGRGDGLAASVAAAARRFVQAGPAQRRRLAAARAADARAARRVELVARRLLSDPGAVAPAAAATAVPAAAPAAVTQMRASGSAPAGPIVGIGLLVLLAAVSVDRVRAQIPPPRLGRRLRVAPIARVAAVPFTALRRSAHGARGDR